MTVKTRNGAMDLDYKNFEVHWRDAHSGKIRVCDEVWCWNNPADTEPGMCLPDLLMEMCCPDAVWIIDPSHYHQKGIHISGWSNEHLGQQFWACGIYWQAGIIEFDYSKGAKAITLAKRITNVINHSILVYEGRA